MTIKTKSISVQNSGFTLVEVMFASALALLLILSLFETISFCRRASANVKWRLAADAIAFDEAWEMFNKQTEWFDTSVPTAQAEWITIDADRTDVWNGNNSAYLFRSIIPDGVPAKKWTIRTNVQWPSFNGSFKRLPREYEVVRYRNDRNIF